MSVRYAVASGLWSSTSTWNGGTLPASTDDVYANNNTVSIDQTITVNSLQTNAHTSPTITAGGRFQVTAAATVNITAGILAAHNFDDGTENVYVNAGSATVTITTPSVTPAVFNGMYGIHIASGQTGDVFVNADINGATSAHNSVGLYCEGASAITITGNILGGSGLSNGVGALFDSSGGFVTVNGNATGGSAAPAILASSSYSGTFTINGTVAGGTAADVYGVTFVGNSGGTGANLIINGVVKPGSAAAAGLSINLDSSNGTIRGDIQQGSYSLGTPAIVTLNGTTNQLRVSGDIWAGGTGSIGGRHGYWPIAGQFVAIAGEALTIHLLDDTGFPASSGGSDVDLSIGGGGGGGGSRPASGYQWPRSN